ncbi:MAG: glutamyl-tRNA reductase [Thaumarchaeota archaeon]|nr:glutamyl-tRNA reductase [Nitrososphaerota archaeon]MCL5317175.1 glutamyl-tRNA reductase [Nitrososphaerota archaeon]
MQGNDRFLTAREMGNIINLRITHKKAPIPVLEAIGFKDVEKTSKEIQMVKGIDECLILQTCNRVEIYLSVSEGMTATTAKSVADCWRMRAGFNKEDFNGYLEVAYGADAIHHLMRLASGLESMIVGEDQILGQIQDAFDKANECGASGAVLRKVFGRAVKMGKVVRVETNINKGAVSIGSIAVNLLEEVAGDIHGKKVLIIGAGRIGALTGKALAAKSLAFIFVANRTYERAASLAKMLNAEAVKFDKLIESLAGVDIAIVTTAAPHYVLTEEKVKESMKLRGNAASNLLIMDLSNPRAVEKEVGTISGVELRNIDNLREIADANLKMRLQEASKAEAMIQKEMERLAVSEKQADVEPLISAVSRKANEIRQRELKKAYCLMKTDPSEEKCGHCQKVMDDLSRTLMEQMMLHPLLNLRSRELDKDDERIALLRELFDVKTAEKQK